MTRMLVPWQFQSPRLLEGFRHEMDHLFDEFFGSEGRPAGTPALYAPRTNLAETENEYEVTLDLPGLKPEEFNVELKDNQLWITGERKEEHEQDGKTWHRVERHYGQFRRVIPLETAVEAEKVAAEYKDGVLRITVPKAEAVRPRRIEVKS